MLLEVYNKVVHRVGWFHEEQRKGSTLVEDELKTINVDNWDVVFPDDLEIEVVGKRAFRKSSIESVVLPPTIKVIEEFAFNGCEKLKSITLPEGITKIDRYAFQGCYSLDKINLPSTIEEVGKNAFYSTIPISLRGVDISQWIGYGNIACRVFNRVVRALTKFDFNLSAPTEVKYQLMWDLYHNNPDDTGVCELLKRRKTNILLWRIKEGDFDSIDKACKADGIITQSNIDKLLKTARENGKQEIFVTLLDYKNRNLEFQPPRLTLL